MQMVQDKKLMEEAKGIIMNWGGRGLTEEEKDMMELYNDFLLNPNSWSKVEEWVEGLIVTEIDNVVERVVSYT